MNPSLSRWLLIAVWPVTASLIVLALGDAGKKVWLIHLLAICLSIVVAIGGYKLVRLAGLKIPAFAIILLTVIGATVPLLGVSPGPSRWVSFGPLSLYLAPLLLPSFLGACGVSVQNGGNRELLSLGAVIGVGILLAAQPDASQVLGLLVGFTVTVARYRSNGVRSVLTLVALTFATLWAFSRPDNLAPVPYVEGVFALAFSHSLLAGIAVGTSAVALVSGLLLGSLKGAPWLSGVAAYYGILFVCSTSGLTPAPLIGFGTGPLLGFGLMVAVSRGLDSHLQSDKHLDVMAH